MNILKKALLHVPKSKLISKTSCKVIGTCQNCVPDIDDECNLTIREKLFCHIPENPINFTSKVTIIGSGHVGMACAICLLAQKVSKEICILSRNREKLTAEMLDLQHGSLYLDDALITAGDDYSKSANSQVCIITAGTAPTASRDSGLQTNTNIMKNIIPKFLETSPHCILIVITNPVDIMSYVAWKVSGLPSSCVIGSGTSIDTSRFRFYLSQLLCLPPSMCHGMIIGEHGPSSVPLWSGVNVAGVRLRDIDPCIGIEEDSEGFHKLHSKVKRAGLDIFCGKGYTSWGIALNCAAITRAVLDNSNIIMPVSTHALGHYCIQRDIFMSLPCTINSCGASSIVKQNLTELEMEQLHASAEVVYKELSKLQI